jgi:hypothetical protein
MAIQHVHTWEVAAKWTRATRPLHVCHVNLPTFNVDNCYWSPVGGRWSVSIAHPIVLVFQVKPWRQKVIQTWDLYVF